MKSRRRLFALAAAAPFAPAAQTKPAPKPATAGDKLRAEIEALVGARLQQAKLEIASDLRQQLRQELRQELKMELKGELRQEIKQDLKMELRYELKNEIKSELRMELR